LIDYQVQYQGTIYITLQTKVRSQHVYQTRLLVYHGRICITWGCGYVIIYNNYWASFVIHINRVYWYHIIILYLINRIYYSADTSGLSKVSSGHWWTYRLSWCIYYMQRDFSFSRYAHKVADLSSNTLAELYDQLWVLRAFDWGH